MSSISHHNYITFSGFECFLEILIAKLKRMFRLKHREVVRNMSFCIANKIPVVDSFIYAHRANTKIQLPIISYLMFSWSRGISIWSVHFHPTTKMYFDWMKTSWKTTLRVKPNNWIFIKLIITYHYFTWRVIEIFWNF